MKLSLDKRRAREYWDWGEGDMVGGTHYHTPFNEAQTTNSNLLLGTVMKGARAKRQTHKHVQMYVRKRTNMYA